MSNLRLIERARQILNAGNHSSADQRTASTHNTKKWKPTASRHTTQGRSKPIWMETEAEVAACQLEFVKTTVFHSGNAYQANKFTISFTYYAHARTYHDWFTSAEAKAQGERFSVFYNAFDPKQNTKSLSNSKNRRALSVVGITCYVIVSLLFLLIAYR